MGRRREALNSTKYSRLNYPPTQPYVPIDKKTVKQHNFQVMFVRQLIVCLRQEARDIRLFGKNLHLFVDPQLNPPT